MPLKIIRRGSKDYLNKILRLKKERLDEELRFWEIMTDPTSYHISQSRYSILNRFMKVQKEPSYQKNSFGKVLYDCKNLLESSISSFADLHGHMQVGRLKRLKYCLDPNEQKKSIHKETSVAMEL